ncbi:glycosyltransferase family 39 protein [Planctomycetota bacterium]
MDEVSPRQNEASATSDKRHLLVVGLMVVAGIVMNVGVLVHDTAPTVYDARDYYCLSLDFQRYLQDSPFPFFERGFWEISTYRPPLMMLVSQLFYAFLGDSLFVARLSVSAFLPVLLFSAYGVGRHVHNAAAGLLSAFFCLTLPCLFGFARTYMQEYALCSMLMLGLYLLLKCEHFTRRMPALAFGCICGLGLLTKWTFGLWMFAPLAVAFWRGSRRRSERRRGLANAGLATLLGAAVAGPWYLTNINEIAAPLWEIAFSPPRPTTVELGLDSGLWTSLVFYAEAARHQFGFHGLALLALSAFSAVYLQCVSRRRAFLLHAYWVTGSVFFLFFVKNNLSARFIMPAFPVLIVLCSAQLTLLSCRRRRAVTVLVALLVFAVSSVHSHLTPAEQHDPAARINESGIQQYAAVSSPLTDVLGIILRARPSDEVALVLSLHNVPEYHCPLSYMIKRRRLPLAEAAPAQWDRLNVEEFDYAGWVKSACFVIHKTGEQGGARDVSRRLQQAFASMRGCFRRIAELPLQDGSSLIIYQRRESRPEAPTRAHRVAFNDVNVRHNLEFWAHPFGPGLAVDAGEYPNWLEFDFTVEGDGIYRIVARYASEEPRPCRLFLDGKLIGDRGLGATTGGWTDGDVKTFEEASVPLSAGKHRLRVENDRCIPHIGGLAVVRQEE